MTVLSRERSGYFPDLYRSMAAAEKDAAGNSCAASARWIVWLLFRATVQSGQSC
jgi:hypothetical protein